ncbi:MAG TPA: O-methyltransferase [Acidimicrobiales bacterium]|nr:O-methyltransferase [Acidimicrobiales bacterium]
MTDANHSGPTDVLQQASSVDTYLASALMPADEVMSAVLQANRAAELPPIDVSPLQGRLLMVLAKAIRARSVLEVGTLGGYSTIWLARGLPQDGHVVTLEAEPRHAEVARANVERAGAGDQVEIRVGAAAQSLPDLRSSEWAPFDLVFVDADKANNSVYFDWAVKLCHPGSLIIVDNVVRQGKVADASSTDPAVVGSRRLFEALSADDRVDATAWQSVGAKGWDGMVIAVVR